MFARTTPHMVGATTSHSRQDLQLPPTILYRRPERVTTGDHEFAVCPRHTAKTRRHTAKTSPTVADGSHVDGKDRVCRVPIVGHTAKLFAVCIYRRTAQKASRRRHGQLTASAVVRHVSAPWTHDENPGFAVCPVSRHMAKLVVGHVDNAASPCAAPRAHGEGTRQCAVPGRPIWSLCRVPWARHTAK